MPEYIIAGQVINHNGNQYTIELFQASASKLFTSTMSDPEGSFGFAESPNDDFYLVVKDDNENILLTSETYSRTLLDTPPAVVALTLPVSVNGCITNHPGEIIFRIKAFDELENPVGQTDTDASGNFVLALDGSANFPVYLKVQDHSDETIYYIDLFEESALRGGSCDIAITLPDGWDQEPGSGGTTTPSDITLSGTVVDNQGTELRVKVFDDTDELLGQDVTNTSGAFSISAKYTEEGKIYYKVLYLNDQMIHSTDPVTTPTSNQSGITINLPADWNANPPENRVISGNIYNPGGTAVSGQVVRLYRYVSGTPTEIGSATTNSSGTYSIDYTNSVSDAPDIYISADNGTVYQSPIFYKAENALSVSLSLGAGFNDQDEYSSLDAAIPTPPSTATPQIIGYLAEQGDFPVTNVQAFLLAKKYESDGSIATNANTVYALVRQGMPKQINQLASSSRDSMIKAYENACDANIIIPSNKSLAATKIDELIGAIGTAIDATGGDLTTIGSLMGASTSTQRKNVVSWFVENGGIDQNFWDNFNSKTGLSTATSAQAAIEINGVVGNNASLTNTLMTTNGFTKPTQLATLNQAAWVTAIGSNIPSGFTGTATDYADHLMLETEKKFPSAVVSHKLSNDSGFEASNTKTFLTNVANMDFDWGTTNVVQFVGDSSHSGWNTGISDDAAAVAEVQAVQRLYRLAPEKGRYEVIDRLWADGYNSGMSVACGGEKSFVNQYKDDTAFGESVAVRESTAREVYSRGQQAAETAFLAYSRHSTYANAVMPIAIKANGFTSADDNQLDQLPNLTSLFGPQDFCRCKHCRSIYSPAAYLVDLLQFLSGIAADDTPGGASIINNTNLRTELLARRDDIQWIDLTCENTNTPMPYIDLVIELLEHEVTGNTPFKPQTTLDAESLRAHPENVDAAAYTTLASAYYPNTLPFNLFRAEADAYLGHLTVPFHQIMDRFPHPGQTVTDSDEEAAYLGMAYEAWGHATGTSVANPTLLQYYDVTSFDSISDFKVKGLMEMAGLTFDEVKEIMDSRFLNIDSLQIRFNPIDSCSLADAYLQFSSVASRTTFLTQLNRFLRLKQATGWTLQELDSAIAGLGFTAVDENCLRAVARVKRIADHSSASVMEVISWFTNLSTRSYGEELSQYEHIFQKPGVFPVDSSAYTALKLNSGQTELNDATQNLDADDISQYVAAALEISAEDMALLIAYNDRLKLERIGTVPNDHPKLTLANLSYLYRVVSFARANNMTVREYFDFRVLYADDFLIEHEYTGTLPGTATWTTYSTASIPDGIEALDVIARLQASNFTIDSANYLLRDLQDVAKPVGTLATDVPAILESIRTSMQDVRSVILEQVTGDTDKASIRKIFALELDETTVDQSMELIEKLSFTAPEITTWSSFINTNWAFFLDATEQADMIISLVDDGGTPALDEEADRVVEVLGKLNAHVEANLTAPSMKEAVVAAMADQTGTDPEVMKPLLYTHVLETGSNTNPAISEFTAFGNSSLTYNTTNFPNLVNTYKRVEKTAIMMTGLKVKAADLTAYFASGGSQGWIAPNNTAHLPLAPIADETSIQFKRLDKTNRDFVLNADMKVEYSITELLTEGASVTGVTLPAFATLLAEKFGWNETDVLTLLDSTGFNYSAPTDFTNTAYLYELSACFEVLQKLGSSASQVIGWNKRALTAVEADEMKSTAKAKYSTDQWLQLAPDLRDPLREKQRDALQGWLIGNRSNYSDPDDLYADLLIDTEMSACALTSRIVQANASIQLYVQRVLMNLEGGIEIDNGNALSLKQEWIWRKKYRVWEANRKVFLYPENWIYPEYRDDKTVFFQDLENELLQDEVNKDTVEQAYKNYLEKLDRVANLEIVQMYVEEGEAGSQEADVLHVFGRTKGQPHKYYYRKFEDGVSWTGWEPLEVEFDSSTICPIMYNRRLMLFWPVFIDKGVEEPSASGTKAKKYLEVKLAWTVFDNGKWQPKKLSRAHLETTNDSLYKLDKDRSYMHADIRSNGELLVHFAPYFQRQPTFLDLKKKRTPPSWYGSGGTIKHPFVFTDCNDEPVTDKYEAPEEWFFTPRSLDYLPKWMKIWNKNGGDFDIATDYLTRNYSDSGAPTGFTRYADESTVRSVKLLDDSLGNEWLMTYPQQYSFFKGQKPFFYEDGESTFFIRPVTKKTQLFATSVSTFSRLLYGDLPLAQSTFDGFLADFNIVANGPNVAQAVVFEPTNANQLTFSNGTTGVFNTDSSRYYNFLVPLDPDEWQFEHFRHYYVCPMIKQLNRFGIDGLLKPELGRSTEDDMLWLQSATEGNFVTDYRPTSKVSGDYPVKAFDFDQAAGYSIYNWELFFHAPLMIANKLSENQRFEEAMEWYHYIFDPTETVGSSPERFWRVKPFNSYSGTTSTAALLDLINGDDPNALAQVAQWRKNPFNTHLLARMRTVPYMKNVVMKYLDNLIAWGDNLFARDTLESLNEATLLYVLAAQILGPKPVVIDKDDVSPQSYNDLINASGGLDAFGNALVELENAVYPMNGTHQIGQSHGAVQSMSCSVLYFCLPENDKLLEYWDIIADRLFKLRNCLSLEGVFRTLPLFEPPIDPGALVKAAGAGVDIGAALSNLFTPLPNYRYSVLYQKAIELCNDVKTLGNALLSALEKKDAETLALLRTQHESDLYKALKLVKEQSLIEAEESLKALQLSKVVTEHRRDFYRSRTKRLARENTILKKYTSAIVFDTIGQGINALAGLMYAIPEADLGAAGISSPVVKVAFGGRNLGNALRSAGTVMSAIGAIERHGATMASTTAGWKRRDEEWDFQVSSADVELEQIDQQIAAAEVRIEMAKRDIEAQDLQITNSEDVAIFMEDKYTNTELYSWMTGQLSGLYFQAYQMAFDMAKKAERAFGHELAIEAPGYIDFGYWDSLKKGLLTGEKLHNDLKRLDIAYLEENERERELTKQVSLAVVDPRALIALRETGKCHFNLEEILYDLDHPGHYRRRIKNVSVTIPCITGPHTNVSAKLSMTANRFRKSTNLTGGYAYTGINDTRFTHNVLGIRSIATSSAQNDTGLFQFDFRDERYLPFEGAGAVSSWNLELPATRQFDYDTISDVILTVQYCAREDAGAFKTAVESHVATNVDNLMDDMASTTGLYRAISLRHEFPSEFHQFMNPTSGTTHTTVLEVTSNHFPALFKNDTLVTDEILLFVKTKDETAPVTAFSNNLFSLSYGATPTVFDAGAGAAAAQADFGGLVGQSHANASNVSAANSWTLSSTPGSATIAPTDLISSSLLDPAKVEDIIVVMHYSK